MDSAPVRVKGADPAEAIKSRSMKPTTPLYVSALLLVMATAHAQDKRLVTRDELRVCMNAEAAIAERKKAVLERNARLREENAAIKADTDALKAEGDKLSADNANMDKFNRKVRAHNARIGEASKVADAINAEVDTLNKETVAHNQQCGGIAYRPEDKEAILKEQAAKK